MLDASRVSEDVSLYRAMARDLGAIDGSTARTRSHPHARENAFAARALASSRWTQEF